MITLLMAFFVMLYAISQVDQAKFDAFLDGLQVPFGNETSAGMLEGGATLLDESAVPDVSGDTSGLMLVPPPMSGGREQPVDTAVEDIPSEEPTDEASEADRSDPVLAIAARLREALRAEGLPPDIAEVRPDERGVVISVASDDVLFALGSARVSSVGQRIVKAVASVVDDLPNEVIVEGHTDNLPLRRTGYDNWNLSTDRAVAVLKLLVRNDVRPRQLVAAGFGEHRPRVENDSDSNRALNRRVDVVLVAE
jgi:chemotaxis protein MotB